MKYAVLAITAAAACALFIVFPALAEDESVAHLSSLTASVAQVHPELVAERARLVTVIADFDARTGLFNKECGSVDQNDRALVQDCSIRQAQLDAEGQHLLAQIRTFNANAAAAECEAHTNATAEWMEMRSRVAADLNALENRKKAIQIQVRKIEETGNDVEIAQTTYHDLSEGFDAVDQMSGSVLGMKDTGNGEAVAVPDEEIKAAVKADELILNVVAVAYGYVEQAHEDKAVAAMLGDLKLAQASSKLLAADIVVLRNVNRRLATCNTTKLVVPP